MRDDDRDGDDDGLSAKRYYSVMIGVLVIAGVLLLAELVRVSLLR
jgi:hypothetical protein